MKSSELKELIKQVIKEESEYNKLFAHMLNRTHKGLNDMSSMEKSKFFNAVDKAYKAKNEGRLQGYNEAELTGGQTKLDIDKDGDIGSDDLADVRAGKLAK